MSAGTRTESGTWDSGQPLKAMLDECVGRGDLAAAREHCLRALRTQPRDAHAHRHLALLQHASQQPAAAQRSAERACELAPGDSRCWSDLGRIHALQNRYTDAALYSRKALQVDPRNADAWHNLGLALRRLDERDSAFDALKNALLLDSTRAESYLALGNLLVESGQLDDAVECFERAARHDPSLARARSRLAHQLTARGRVGRAERLFRDSLGLDPDHLPGWLGLGRVLEDVGQAEGALACYRNVLARQPDHALALGQYLALVKDAPDPSALASAQAVLQDPATRDEASALVAYGMLKHHDRRRDYARAAEAGLAANAARRRSAGPLDRDTLTSRVDSIIATCTQAFFRERARYGQGTDQPVFIVGLPRSGTTLTEQILVQNPLLHGAGELPDLARIAAACVSPGETPWQAVLGLDAMSSRECAGKYLDALRAGAPRGRLRIIDKSPLNFYHLGFIAVLFPNARVIHCSRGARDNALSIWMENFNPTQQYATDFDDLAFYAAQYRRLMEHWRKHLPLELLECRYEDTVADLESQARRLLEFLGVPWDVRCLQFHENARAVQTPSRWQVRQPVYTSSIGRWKSYESLLPQLMQAFGADD